MYFDYVMIISKNLYKTNITIIYKKFFITMHTIKDVKKQYRILPSVLNFRVVNFLHINEKNTLPSPTKYGCFMLIIIRENKSLVHKTYFT